MRIDAKVIPGAKRNAVQEEGGTWKIHLTAPAVDGKANKALISALSEYFSVPKNRIEIIKGLKSRRKTIIIEDI